MPRVLICHPEGPSAEILGEAARVLRAGGLVAFPTETVYGLGALALDARALARVFEAKGRPASHPLIAHVTGEAEARSLAASWPEAAARMARAFWPGPLTIVVDRAAHVPPAIAGGGTSIAVRVPSHPVARALLDAVGAPVAAPSANRYQGISPTTAAHVLRELGDRIDLVIDAGPCAEGIESTVVDARRDPPEVLRPGVVGLAALRAVAAGVAGTAGATIHGAEGRASPGMDARHYAPRARMLLAPTLADAIATAHALRARGGDSPGDAGALGTSGSVALIVRDAVSPPDATGLVVRTLPRDPAGYARLLYATLHDLDEAGVAAIVVQAVPADEAWWAVADRLARGSAERS